MEKRVIDPKAWYMGIAIKKSNTRYNVLAIYRKEFKKHSDVLYFMKINGKTGNLAYMPIKGSDAIEYGFKFVKGCSLNARIERLFCYDYPIERLSKQDRKSFRTKSRRWMRDYKIRLNTYNDFKSDNYHEAIHTDTQEVSPKDSKRNKSRKSNSDK